MAFQKIAVLGCGLIGGSFALGLKKRGYAGKIIGWDKEDVLQKAQERGAIDRGTEDGATAVEGAELIYLAAPVVVILDLLPQVGRHAKAGALVTDAGSTKVRVCRMAKQVLPETLTFLGGHPMAGKEVSGIENADADLFMGSKYVVVKEAEEAEEAKEKADSSSRPEGSGSGLGMTEAAEEFLDWVRRLGAEPVELDAETHDWAVALVSQAPQLLSTALASAVWDETDEDGLPLSLAGTGFRDMTRLAASPYDLWRDICLTNSENLERALERLEARLQRLRTRLRSKELADEFEKGQELTRQLRENAKR
ncbi:prephenate dehydrogenase/arogenate dehydrogenase family protein [Acidobacteriia bacterium AH_259_A11_L15]|nr:prephenate dehydrogenase/arogenate dehydrogenase family protein [Acidobacteriia bacterium AH_259_A11_L15]